MSSSIWTEKYRPQTFDEVKGQKEIVEKVKAFVKSGSMPHLLFSGPAGIGKCITGDTPIMLGTGEVKTIKDCYSKKIKHVMTLGPQGEFKSGEVAYFYKNKSESLIHLNSISGSNVKVTPEHPFLILKDGVPTWTEAYKVNKDDLLATPLKIKPQIKEELLKWEKHPCFWAKLSSKILVPVSKLQSGLKKKVLVYLEKNGQGTNKQIAELLNEKIKCINWATSEMVKERILIGLGNKSKIFSLKNKLFLTDEVPCSLVKDNSLIKEIIYRNNNRKSKTNISFFEKTSPEFYEWLGLVFGDGHVRNSSIRFYNKNDRLRLRFKELTEQVFGTNLHWQENIRLGVPYLEIMHSRVITAILEHFYNIPVGKKKSDKLMIPTALFTAEDENVSSFIRGFYESDGCFSNGKMEISSSSEKFINGLDYLLLRLGIHARIKRRKNQSYLIIHNRDNLKKFSNFVQPCIKKINLKESQRISNSNIDLMDFNLKHTNVILNYLGIQQQEIGDKYSTSYVFEREKASRVKVQQIYSQICILAKKRINLALETIALCDSVNYDINEPLDNLFKELGDSKLRKKIGNISEIRSNRINDYHNQKREPNLTNVLKVVKSMKQLKHNGSEELYAQLTQTTIIRPKLVNALQSLNISYVELASVVNEFSENINETSGSINNCLTGAGMSLQTIKKINFLTQSIKKVVETRVFNEELMESLELLQYLSTADIFWDKVKSVEKIKGEEVYDLNVKETHNFVGGYGPFVLHNTTLSLVIAKQLFGENWRQNTLELNASDERGIDVIRVKVKDFARTKALGNVPFKLIYLDESDALTREAQQALRRTMENYTKTCRFVLSCNYSSKIIDPIQSRCAVFRFKPLSNEEMEEVIAEVSAKEGLTIGLEARTALAEVTGGDCRRLKNIMQSCAVMGKEISTELIYSMASVAKPKEVKEVLDLAAKGSFIDARKKLLDLMLNFGLSGLDVIKQIQKELWNLELDDKKKVRLVSKCGEVEFRMVEGSDEYVQLESFLAFVVLVGLMK